MKGICKMSKKVLEIRGLIHSKFDSESAFAEYLGWSRQQLNKITTGKRMPSLQETFVLSKALDVNFEEMAQIFLKFWSSKEQQNTA